jgi:hypothetical protein
MSAAKFANDGNLRMHIADLSRDGFVSSNAGAASVGSSPTHEMLEISGCLSAPMSMIGGSTTRLRRSSMPDLDYSGFGARPKIDCGLQLDRTTAVHPSNARMLNGSNHDLGCANSGTNADSSAGMDWCHGADGAAVGTSDQQFGACKVSVPQTVTDTRVWRLGAGVLHDTPCAYAQALYDRGLYEERRDADDNPGEWQRAWCIGADWELAEGTSQGSPPSQPARRASHDSVKFAARVQARQRHNRAATRERGGGGTREVNAERNGTLHSAVLHKKRHAGAAAASACTSATAAAAVDAKTRAMPRVPSRSHARDTEQRPRTAPERVCKPERPKGGPPSLGEIIQSRVLQDLRMLVPDAEAAQRRASLEQQARGRRLSSALMMAPITQGFGGALLGKSRSDKSGSKTRGCGKPVTCPPVAPTSRCKSPTKSPVEFPWVVPSGTTKGPGGHSRRASAPRMLKVQQASTNQCKEQYLRGMRDAWDQALCMIEVS